MTSSLSLAMQRYSVQPRDQIFVKGCERLEISAKMLVKI